MLFRSLSKRKRATRQMVEHILARRVASEARKGRKAPEPAKRKRGRPRLSSSRASAKTTVKIEELPVDIPVVIQPRATNGRFGRKDKMEKPWRKSRGVNSTAAKSDDDDDDDDDDVQSNAHTSPRRKRGIDAVDDFEEPPKKKSASERNPDSGDIEGPGHKVLPRPVSEFRGGRLFSNPNPLRFALHAWAGPLILDESSSDDEKQPETPEDGLSSAADIAAAEELSPTFLPSILPRAPLTYKPSPFVFAKNRWNGTLAALNKVADNNKRISTSSILSKDKLWPNPRKSRVEEVTLFRSVKYFS